MNKETKKVLAGAAAVWVLTVAGFGYNAYRQEIKMEDIRISLKVVSETAVRESQLMTQEEIQKINEFRAAHPASEGEKYAPLFQGGVRESMEFLSPPESIVVEVSRAGFANEKEAIEAGFLVRNEVDGITHTKIDGTKAKI